MNYLSLITFTVIFLKKQVLCKLRKLAAIRMLLGRGEMWTAWFAGIEESFRKRYPRYDNPDSVLQNTTGECLGETCSFREMSRIIIASSSL